MNELFAEDDLPPGLAVPRVKNADRQRGASLLEAIAYLGIAAIVVVGAIALLNNAFSSANTNELSQQVSALQTGVRKLYMGQPNGYTGLSNSVALSAGLFPATLAGASTTTVLDTWSGNVTLTGTATSFTIEFDSVPNDVCIHAVTTPGSWTSISVNGALGVGTVTPDQAATVCAGSPNTIIWTST